MWTMWSNKGTYILYFISQENMDQIILVSLFCIIIYFIWQTYQHIILHTMILWDQYLFIYPLTYFIATMKRFIEYLFYVYQRWNKIFWIKFICIKWISHIYYYFSYKNINTNSICGMWHLYELHRHTAE